MSSRILTQPSTLSWGIIGCGDVTEKKSGPAFNKVANSRLAAVMRRNGTKAASYAKRHYVPKWYSNAAELIDDPGVNAIYVATPPAYHEEYVIASLQKGKPVYVEKPVTVSVDSGRRMLEAVEKYNGKLCVAHYRRALPFYVEIKKVIRKQLIGKIKMVRLTMFQPHASGLITPAETNWRLIPAISGGGLFFDAAPHQLDILIWLLGDPLYYMGTSLHQSDFYTAEDTVAGTIIFGDDILFSGNWCFTMPASLKEDSCKIIGEKGAIEFAVFGNRFSLQNENGIKAYTFEHPEHIQQPMIQKVTDYFLGQADNPCPMEEAIKSLQVMEAFLKG